MSRWRDGRRVPDFEWLETLPMRRRALGPQYWWHFLRELLEWHINQQPGMARKPREHRLAQRMIYVGPQSHGPLRERKLGIFNQRRKIRPCFGS